MGSDFAANRMFVAARGITEDNDSGFSIKKNVKKAIDF